MNNTSPIEARLEILESRSSFIDDQLDHVNVALFRQQQQIDRLLQIIMQLQQQLADSNDSVPHALPNERPPHY